MSNWAMKPNARITFEAGAAFPGGFAVLAAKSWHAGVD
jgi:hypothetical protein